MEMNIIHVKCQETNAEYFVCYSLVLQMFCFCYVTTVCKQHRELRVQYEKSQFIQFSKKNCIFYFLLLFRIHASL